MNAGVNRKIIPKRGHALKALLKCRCNWKMALSLAESTSGPLLDKVVSINGDFIVLILATYWVEVSIKGT